MFYIRTEKNKYDIDVIIDVSDNEDFVKTSGFNWIEIDSEVRPNEGSYFYNEQIISLGSENYHLIEEIIFEKEEPDRIEREKNLAEIVEIEELLEEQETVIETELTQEQREILLNLPKPKAITLEDVESNRENYDLWSKNLKNIDVAIKAYESGNYTFENNEIKFNPPIEFPDGVIQHSVIIPLTMTVEEQIQHLKNQRQHMIDLLNRIKIDLEIEE